MGQSRFFDFFWGSFDKGLGWGGAVEDLFHAKGVGAFLEVVGGREGCTTVFAEGTVFTSKEAFRHAAEPHVRCQDLVFPVSFIYFGGLAFWVDSEITF